MTALVDMRAEGDALAELAQVEAALAQLEDDQLSEAWQWIKDVEALIKARNMASQIAIRAKRIEARILRRLGPQDNMHSTARYVARNLQEMADSEFEQFLASLSEHTAIYGDVRKWKGEEDTRHRLEAMRARALAGMADEYDERVSVAAAANRLIAEVLADGEAVTTSDAIDVLGEMCDLDPREEVNRKGLQYLLRRAASSAAPDDERYTVWDGEPDAAPVVGYIPAAVTYQVDGQWVRSAWSAASLAQLAANVEMVEAQAAERVEAAQKMRGLLDQLRAVPAVLGMDDIDDSAKASDVLMLGRINGLIASKEAAVIRPKSVHAAAKAFPRMFDGADGVLARHLGRLVEHLAEFAITEESQLDEGIAERLADRLWTGANGVSMERYAAAYAPKLAGTFRRSYLFGGAA